ASSYIGKELIGTNLRLSVLGVGTDQGAPIPLADGSFAKDSGGNIVMPRLDRTPLLELARRHSGQYSDLSADNSDLERLLTHMNAPLQSLNTQHKQLDRNFDSWHDQGYWLALLLLPLVVLAFRKGLVACLLLAPILVSQPSSGEEQQVEKTITSQLPNFLKTPDQRGQQAFQQQQFDAARQQFSSPQWRGSAAYRQGDYQAALEAFQQDNSANGLYNQGNALARLGEFDKAIEAYDKALEKDPDLQDAAANKELLEQLKQQQQNQQGEDHQKGQDQSDSDSEQQNSESENPESENSEQESQQNSQQESQQNSQPDQQQDSQQQNSDQSQNENQQPEDGSEDQQQQSPEPGEQEQQEKDEQQPSQGASQQNSDEEAEQAMEQFLRKVPDDPGAFLREKFRRQQQRQKRQPQPERW
ncbi:MAG: tetratricopeptide repeat protein, partial [Porticoccaceae bacterium]|nr:tetratricopeptide repeat protein [Porticoccaceae bacterium]